MSTPNAPALLFTPGAVYLCPCYTHAGPALTSRLSSLVFPWVPPHPCQVSFMKTDVPGPGSSRSSPQTLGTVQRMECGGGAVRQR